jgi:hypothetical protein
MFHHKAKKNGANVEETTHLTAKTVRPLGSPASSAAAPMSTIDDCLGGPAITRPVCRSHRLPQQHSRALPVTWCEVTSHLEIRRTVLPRFDGAKRRGREGQARTHRRRLCALNSRSDQRVAVSATRHHVLVIDSIATPRHRSKFLSTIVAHQRVTTHQFRKSQERTHFVLARSRDRCHAVVLKAGRPSLEDAITGHRHWPSSMRRRARRGPASRARTLMPFCSLQPREA